MSGGVPYKLDKAPAVKEQVKDIAAIAKQAGSLRALIALVEEAASRLQSDPSGWGDPEYRAKHVNAVFYHAMLRPLAFRYVVFEEARSVLILNIKLIAGFDGGADSAAP